MARILILDDNHQLVELYESMFIDEGYEVANTVNPDKAIDLVHTFKPDLVTLDISFSRNGEEADTQGVEILRHMRKKWPLQELPVVVISGEGTTEELSEMLKLGINEYFIKPISDYEAFLKKIATIIKAKSLTPKENRKKDIGQKLIGKSPQIMKVIMDLQKAAETKSDIFVTGETGTGKEMIFKKYCEFGENENRPCVIIDCPTIPKELFEAEVFGQEDGAYSGAKYKKGKIEDAKGGVVFFDEIGELTLEHQSKLLRLLEEKTFCRLGSTKRQEVKDTNFIFATHKNLKKGVQENWVREDFYSRLERCYPINVPPLRERLDDIPLLANYFIDQFNQQYNKHIADLKEEVIEKLKTCPWDKNIRQLENYLRNAVRNCSGDTLEWDDIKPFLDDCQEREEEKAFDVNYQLSYSDLCNSCGENVERVKAQYIEHYLKQYQYSVKKAADAMGMKSQQLSRLIKQLNISLNK